VVQSVAVGAVPQTANVIGPRSPVSSPMATLLTWIVKGT
jgi:hypothetical protein